MTTETKAWYCKKCKTGIRLSDENEMHKHTDHKMVPIYQYDASKSSFISLWCYPCGKQTSGKPEELEEHENHDEFVGLDKRTPEKRQAQFKQNLTGLKQKNKGLDESKEQLVNLGTPMDEEPSDAEKCLQLALANSRRFVISPENSFDVNAVIFNGRHIEVIDLRSKRARQWLCNLYRSQRKEVFGDDFYKKVLSTMASIAIENDTPRERIYNRIAQLDEVLYYDLANKDNEGVKITKEGVEIVKFDETMPLFRRGQTTYEQVKPRFDDPLALDKIIKLSNLVESDKLLYKVNVCACFLESISVPIPFFDGSAGSFKTFVTAMIKMTVDPSGDKFEDNVSAMSNKGNDFILQLYNRYLLPLDNISHVPKESSDILCRSITGSSNPRRQLYEDVNEVILTMKRKVVMNGVAPNIEDDTDLTDRTLSYARKNSKDVQIIAESELRKQFLELLPDALGCIFTAISKAMVLHSKLAIKPKTRLADFEEWGESISLALGNEEGVFLEQYYAKRNESAMENKEKYPIIDIIIDELKEKQEIDDTMTSLFERICAVARAKQIDTQSKYIRFPKASNQLSGMLKTITPILQKMGIFVEIYHYTKADDKHKKNTSMVRIGKIPIQSTLDFTNV